MNNHLVIPVGGLREVVQSPILDEAENVSEIMDQIASSLYVVKDEEGSSLQNKLSRLEIALPGVESHSLGFTQLPKAFQNVADINTFSVFCHEGNHGHPRVVVHSSDRPRRGGPINPYLPFMSVAGHEIFPGVTAIMGGPVTGKTSMAESNIYVSGGVTSVLRYNEPSEDRYVVAREEKQVTWCNSLGELIANLGSHMLDGEGNDVIVIDSLSEALYWGWSQYGTAKLGLNPGFFFWLTQLNNAAVRLGKVMFIIFNTSYENTEVSEQVGEFLRGRVSAVIRMSSPSAGQITSRHYESRGWNDFLPTRGDDSPSTIYVRDADRIVDEMAGAPVEMAGTTSTLSLLSGLQLKTR